MQIIATPSESPSSSYRVTLDGEVYRLRLAWSERRLGWYLDVADEEGDPIIEGRRLCVAESPLAGVADLRAPRGRFLVLGIEPYRKSDLGDNVILIYIPADEVPEPTRPVEYVYTVRP